MAETQATKEAIYLRNLQNDLDPETDAKPTIIYCDNQAAINLAKNQQYHARSKHIDIQHKFVNEKVADGLVELRYIPTSDQVADGLTKALPKDKFVDFCIALGLESPSGLLRRNKRLRRDD